MCGVGVVVGGLASNGDGVQAIADFFVNPQQELEIASAEHASDHTDHTTVASRLVGLLAPRGPDSHCTQPARNSQLALTLVASTLHMVHPALPQPVVGEDGSVLMLNGEVYNAAQLAHEFQVGSGLNDTHVVHRLVQRLAGGQADILPAVLSLLPRLQGPYAIVFWHAPSHTLLLARDPVGRRSLVVSRSDGNNASTVQTVVGSVALDIVGPPAVEVPPRGVFAMTLGKAWSLLRFAPFPAAAPGTVLGCVAQGDEDWAAGFRDVMTQAVRLRVSPESVPYASVPRCGDVPGKGGVGVLFSGGVDSALLAALADREMPVGEPLELLTVHFALERTVPRDRELAIRTWRELQAASPSQRSIRLVMVEVDQDELDAHKPTLHALLHPTTTVMDFNIGAALYFAARGRGRLVNANGTLGEAATCRALLLGSGADEQCGGYKRHMHLLQTLGAERLAQELQMEMRRLWTRNLGRDDRCVSHSGREPRHPFLDQAVVDFLARVPIERRLDAALPRGVGDKLLIRGLARELGLAQASGEPKVAIQFGSLIAKHAKRTSGNDQYQF